MTTKKKSKKKSIVLLVVFAVCAILILVVCSVAYSQRSNIAALKYATSYSSAEIKDKFIENEEAIAEQLEKITDAPFRALTNEERKKLQSGELTEEEAIEYIKGAFDHTSEDENSAIDDESEKSSNQKNEPDVGQDEIKDNRNTQNSDLNSADVSTNSENNQKSQEAADSSKIDSLVAQIYLLEAEYLNSIDALIAEASADKKSGTSAMQLMKKYNALGSDLEGQCDDNMHALLSELESELVRAGADKSIVPSIESAYEEKKHLKKAELVSRFT